MYNYVLLIFTILLLILIYTGVLEYIDNCSKINKIEGIGKLGRSVRRVTRSVSRGARNVGRRISRTARNVGGRIGGAFGRVGGLSSGLINKVKRAVKTVDRLPGQINNGLGRINNAFREIGKLGRKIEGLGREVGGFGQKVGGEIGGVWDKVKTFAEKEFKRVEGVAKNIAGEVEDVAKDLAGKVEGKATSLAGEVNDIAYEVGGVIEDIPGEVEGLAKTIFLDKIPRFFKQVWGWIKRNIIDPMIGFFVSIGDVFQDIGNIFVEMFYFLIRIPGCIPVYMFDASKSIVWNVYLTVFPKWIKNINRWIHINITIPFIYPLFAGIIYIWQILLELFGFKFKLNFDTSKCYETGVIGQIIDEIMGFIKLVFGGIGDLFKMIDINSIINQIVSIF
tara:strand:- start:178 stop:1353 length:1176 start_codon:yes stop_codon:yes gene_type:complete